MGHGTGTQEFGYCASLRQALTRWALREALPNQPHYNSIEQAFMVEMAK